MIVNLILDKWLSECLGRDSFRLVFDEGHGTYDNSLRLLLERVAKPTFVYVKVSTFDKKAIRTLEKEHFCLAETNIIFEKALCNVFEKTFPVVQGVRFATNEDEEAVAVIARNNFVFDRFHQDKFIDNKIVDALKEKWARSYFQGKRGTHMIVSESNNSICGFLQLIKKDTDSFIDLIAVDKASRGYGWASKMILFIEYTWPETKRVIVGTQQTNVPSINLYQKLGFKIKESNYVYHLHIGKINEN